jgi:hypothetical protein
MIVTFCFVLMFFFVPETFWDRTPRRCSKGQRTSFASISNAFQKRSPGRERAAWAHQHDISNGKEPIPVDVGTGFLPEGHFSEKAVKADGEAAVGVEPKPHPDNSSEKAATLYTTAGSADSRRNPPVQPSQNTISATDLANTEILDTVAAVDLNLNGNPLEMATDIGNQAPSRPSLPRAVSTMSSLNAAGVPQYTSRLRGQPAKTFMQTLKPWNGKLRNENWVLVALRPFVLFAYPAILWSTLVYSLSIGWLIVLSESVSYVYRDKATYNFSSLGTGLVYISPFVGGILGTAVAGKVSDIIVRYMSRRNEGIYEPEFRLVMALPVAISTCIGLMGFGWSAGEKDKWIVPTTFFGIISFGCSLGSTTAITFAVDSYRQFAGEALVTLNFSKSGSKLSYCKF